MFAVIFEVHSFETAIIRHAHTFLCDLLISDLAQLIKSTRDRKRTCKIIFDRIVSFHAYGLNNVIGSERDKSEIVEIIAHKTVHFSGFFCIYTRVFLESKTISCNVSNIP